MTKYKPKQKRRFRFDRKTMNRYLESSGSDPARPSADLPKKPLMDIGERYTGKVIAYGKLGDLVVFYDSNQPRVMVRNCRQKIGVGEFVDYEVKVICQTVIFADYVERRDSGDGH